MFLLMLFKRKVLGWRWTKWLGQLFHDWRKVPMRGQTHAPAKRWGSATVPEANSTKVKAINEYVGYRASNAVMA